MHCIYQEKIIKEGFHDLSSQNSQIYKYCMDQDQNVQYVGLRLVLP